MSTPDAFDGDGGLPMTPRTSGIASLRLEQAEPPWRAIYKSWGKRENDDFRAFMVHLLNKDSLGPDGPKVMRLWRLASRAAFAGQIDQLCEELGLVFGSTEERLTWDRIADELFKRIDDLLPSRGTGEASLVRTLFLVFVYFEVLVFWENGVFQDEGRAFAKAMRQLEPAGSELHESDGTVEVTPVVEAIRHLMASLSHQFDVADTSLSTCCSVLMADASSNAVRELRVARALLEAPGASETLRLPDTNSPGSERHPPDRLGSESINQIRDLLVNDIDESLPYYELLSEKVGPAATAFGNNLLDRRSDADVRGLLVDAIRECLAFEQSAARQHGVLGTEVTAHRFALNEGLRLLGGHSASQGDDGERTIRFTSAGVTYIYPFGLPINSLGRDDVRQALRSMFKDSHGDLMNGGPTLGTLRTIIDDTPQTDVWLEEAESDELDYVGVRLLFPEHDLCLITSDGWTFEGLGLEIRLGGLGNHYVRITVSTDSSCRKDGVPFEDGRPWTPHQMDQFIRRCQANFSLEPSEGNHAPHDHVVVRRSTVGLGVVGPEEDLVFSSFTELAIMLVREVVRFGARIGTPVNEGEDYKKSDLAGPTGLEENLAQVEPFLARHRQTIVAIRGLETVGSGGISQVVESSEDLADCAFGDGARGMGTVLMPQRPTAQSPLDWLRYPTIPDDERQTRSLHGRIRNEFLWCSGEVAVVIAPTLPNWMMLEVVELMEFSASLMGVYARRYSWLQDEIHEANLQFRMQSERMARRESAARTGSEAQSAPDLELQLVATELTDRVDELRRRLREVRQIEADLDECLNHIRSLLDRAHNFQLSRDLQGRALVRFLTQLNGVSELRSALEGTLSSAVSQQRLVAGLVVQVQDLLDGALTEQRRVDAEARRIEEEMWRNRAERPVRVFASVIAATALIDLFWWTNTSWGEETNHSWWVGEMLFLAIVASTLLILSIAVNRGRASGK